MSDLISISALKKYMRDYKWEFALNSDFSKAIEMVDVQPTIEAVPVVERNKIIDEFAERCKADIMCQTFGLHPINIDKIAEKMKGGAD